MAEKQQASGPRCCADRKNIGHYQAVTQTGWAGFCKKCGCTWHSDPPRADDAA